MATISDNQGHSLQLGSNLSVPVSVVGSLTNKSEISTIANAINILAGASTSNLDLGIDGTEDEVWVAVNIDKQPWTLKSDNFLGFITTLSNYPVYSNHATAYTTALSPAMSFLLSVLAAVNQGLTAPTTFTEAKNMRMPYKSGMKISVTNGHATDTATVTIKVIRVWR